ncbi:hypothetical protein AAMO2058_000866800 [Amorphochlora amoebiformis]
MASPNAKEHKHIFAKNYLKCTKRDELIRRLKVLAKHLASYKQEPEKLLEAVPKSLMQPTLMKSKNAEIKLLVALCHAEVLRIWVPNPPYTEKQQKDIFQLFLRELPGVGKAGSNTHYSKCFHLLENLAQCQAFLILNDLDEALTIRLFKTFFDIRAEDLGTQVIHYMVQIMESIIVERESVSDILLETILVQLTGLPREKKSNGYAMALSLIRKTEGTLENEMQAYFREKLIQKGEEGEDKESRKDYLEMLHELAINNQDLSIPILTEYSSWLEVEKPEERLECIEFFGNLFSSEECVLSQEYMSLLKNYVLRMKDVNAGIRCSILNKLHKILPKAPKMDKLLELLEDRASDIDEKVRLAATNCIISAASAHPECVSSELLLALGNRALDKRMSVRRPALVGLAHLFKKHISERWKSKRPLGKSQKKFTWCATRLIQCGKADMMTEYFVEGLLDDVILAVEYSPAERARCLIGVYASIPEDDKITFHNLLSKKKAMNDCVRSLMEASRKLEENPGDDDLKKRLEVQVQRVASKLPDPGQNYSRMDMVRDLFTHDHDQVKNLLEKMVDPLAEYDVLRASRKELLRILEIEDKSPPFVFFKRLIQRLCNTVIPVDGVQVLLEEVKEQMEKGRRKLAIPGLQLLDHSGKYFPAIASPSASKLIDMAADAKEGYVSLIVEVLSYCNMVVLKPSQAKAAIPKLSSIIKQKIEKTSKLATRTLCKISKSSKELRSLVNDIVSTLRVGGKHLVAGLQIVGEIALNKSELVMNYEDELLALTIDELLPAKLGKKVQIQHKVAAVEFLQDFMMGFQDPESVANSTFPRVVETLWNILQDESTSPELEIAVGKAGVKFCSVQAFYSKIKETPSFFIRLAFIMESSKAPEFAKIVIRSITTVPYVGFEFFSFLALANRNPQQFKRLAPNLRNLILRQRKMVDAMEKIGNSSNRALVALYPESATAYLVYILSQHPSLETEAPSYRTIQRYFQGFFQFFSHGNEENHFSLIVNILTQIKLHRDAKDAANKNIYLVAEIAHKCLKLKFKNKNWKETNHPLAVSLPKWLYKYVQKTEDEKGKAAQRAASNQYLPEGFTVTKRRSPSPTRRKRKTPIARKGRKKRRDEDDEESDGGHSVPKENLPPRPRHSRLTRSTAKVTKTKARAETAEEDREDEKIPTRGEDESGEENDDNMETEEKCREYNLTLSLFPKSFHGCNE